MHAQTGIYGYAAYSASKFALVGMAQALQMEVSGPRVQPVLCVRVIFHDAFSFVLFVIIHFHQQLKPRDCAEKATAEICHSRGRKGKREKKYMSTLSVGR